MADDVNPEIIIHQRRWNHAVLEQIGGAALVVGGVFCPEAIGIPISIVGGLTAFHGINKATNAHTELRDIRRAVNDD